MRLHREHHRDEAAGDRRGARAAVRLDHVAVDPDRPLAQLRQSGHRSQRSSDQALDFLRASADLAGGGLALRARRGRAWQHPVLGRHPTFARVPKKGRHTLLDARRTHDPRSPNLDEDRALGMQQETWRHLRRSQIRRRSPVASVSCLALVGLDPLQVLDAADAEDRRVRPACRLPFRRSRSELCVIAGRFVVSALTIA